MNDFWDITVIQQFITIHSEWNYLIVFIVIFLESIAFVGLIVPGTIVLTSIGALIGADLLSIYPTIISASLGAIAGDFISFFLGRRYHKNLTNIWPLTKHPYLVNKSTTFFHVHGGKSILLARFIGPIRGVVPLIAGTMRMPVKRFLWIDIFSGIIWPPIYMLPGIFISIFSAHIAPKNYLIIIIIILISFFLGWLIFALLRKYNKAVSAYYNTQLTYWQTTLSSLYQKNIINYKSLKRNQILTKTIISILLFCSFFFLLLILAYAQQPLRINIFIQSIIDVFLTDKYNIIWHSISFAGNKYIILFIYVLVTATLLKHRDHIAAFIWTLYGALLVAIIWFCKNFIIIERPEPLLRTLYSFPSFHAALFIGLIGLSLSISTYNKSNSTKIYSWTVFTILGILLAISRLILDLHWFTDIIASFILGGAIWSIFSLHFTAKPIEIDAQSVILKQIVCFMTSILLISLYQISKNIL